MGVSGVVMSATTKNMLRNHALRDPLIVFWVFRNNNLGGKMFPLVVLLEDPIYTI